MDTIFALATARARAGVAVIRVSGPEAHDAGRTLCGSLPGPGDARLRKVRTPSGDVLDEALVLVFDEGRSFTGEAVVEFQLHGSLAVVDSVLSALQKIEGLRPAEAGEFTRRAFLNDRLDLTQVEGLAALIDAETEAQRVLAQRVFDGALGRLVDGWRTSLIEAAALIEATIDFAEEDVPEDVVPEVTRGLAGLLSELRSEIDGARVAERLQDGFEVAIVGSPNVGKSTLLNKLAKRDVAIVSDLPGTTRDTLEVRLDLGGLPVTLVDTAGVRETNDPVESIGVARGRKRAETADIRIFLVDSTDQVETPELKQGDVVLISKDDHGAFGEKSISGISGHGIANLLSHLQRVLEDRLSVVGTVSTARQSAALGMAADDIDAALALIMSGEDAFDIAAERLRSANVALSALIGRVDVEDLLDHIFSSFCIGK